MMRAHNSQLAVLAGFVVFTLVMWLLTCRLERLHHQAAADMATFQNMRNYFYTHMGTACPLQPQHGHLQDHHNNCSECNKVSCRALMEGDASEMRKAKMYMQFYPKVVPSDLEMYRLTSDCEFTQRYHKTATSLEERDFPIAFSLLVHEGVAQVEQLLRTIYRPHNLYCVHVDADARQEVKLALANIARCLPNVMLASQQENVVYAGYSRLKAEMNCMWDLLQYSHKWKYFINLAGQVFPLKTNRELVSILKVYNGTNDIEALSQDRFLKSRVQFVFKPKLRKGHTKVLMTRHKKEPPPAGLQLVRGSAYGVFSRQMLQFVFNNSVARDLLKWSEDTYSPDEHYWATLNHLQYNPWLGTPGGYRGQPENKPWLAAFVAWKGERPCGGKYVRDVCVFGIEDLPTLVSRRELFANKFYINYQYLTLECLEQWIHNKTEAALPMDLQYYRDLPFVKH